MFLNFLRAAEPYFKALSRSVSPWKGNHVIQSDLRTTVVPWGFVSQQKVQESVTPSRDGGKVEQRAEHLNLDTWEFLQGAEEAYRCTARLFAPPRPQSSSLPPATAISASERSVGSRSEDASDGGQGAAGFVRENAGGEGGGGGGEREADGMEQAAQGVDLSGGPLLRPALKTATTPMTNFLEFNVASPQMSMFLNDVLESYRLQGLVPRLSVTNVEARLCSAGVRLGGISKNINFLGSMSADEVKYHLTMGMLGPEGAVINELEGRAPQKVIADVELTCDEEFVLEDEAGKVVYRPETRGPRVHYLTLQSNIGQDAALEWQITNINDVIKPTLAYYFVRFGH